MLTQKNKNIIILYNMFIIMMMMCLWGEVKWDGDSLWKEKWDNMEENGNWVWCCKGWFVRVTQHWLKVM